MTPAWNSIFQFSKILESFLCVETAYIMKIWGEYNGTNSQYGLLVLTNWVSRQCDLGSDHSRILKQPKLEQNPLIRPTALYFSSSEGYNYHVDPLFGHILAHASCLRNVMNEKLFWVILGTTYDRYLGSHSPLSLSFLISLEYSILTLWRSNLYKVFKSEIASFIEYYQAR